MLFFLLALFSSVYSATWYQIDNNQQLTDQTSKYYVYTAQGDNLREIKFSLSSTLAFASVTIDTCFPGSGRIVNGCLLQTSCDLYITPCNFVKGQTYFVTVNLGVGALPFNISVAESAVTVTNLPADGSAPTNVSTLFPRDGSQNSYAIFSYDVTAAATLNQFYIDASPLGSTTIAYTNDPSNVCVNEADLPSSLYNQNAFSAYFENGASCSSKGAGARYIYAASTSLTGWAVINPVDNSPSSTVINDGTNTYSWVNQSRPVGFYYFDVAANSYASVTFLTPATTFCRASASKGNNPAGPASNYGSCTPALRTTSFGNQDSTLRFGPCDAGRWYFSVVCTTVVGTSYNLEIDSTTTATSSINYTSVAYGTNSSHTGNSDVFLTFTNTGTYTLDDGTPKKVVTLNYYENSGLSYTSRASFSRSDIDPGNSQTACAGIQQNNLNTGLGYAAVSWWPCSSTVQSGDLNVVLRPQGGGGGGGNQQDYTVNAVVQSATSLGQNSSDTSATYGGSSNIYSVDLGSQSDLTILEITSNSNNQLLLQDVSTCVGPSPTASYAQGTKVVAFCQPQNDNLVYYTRGSNLVNNYTITSTVYPLPSTLRHQWTDKTQDFQITIDQNFQVVDVSVDNEAFTLDFTTVSGAGTANIHVYQDCTRLTSSAINFPNNNQFQLLEDTFSGTLRITFSVGTVLPVPPVINITYSGGQASTCAKFSVVGLFCGPVLDPSTYYYCGSNNGDCGTAGGSVDSLARDTFNTIQAYFNQSTSSECDSVLNSFVCEPLYFKCSDNGAIERNCNNQCADIANKCGYNKCFDDQCNNAEYAVCTGNPPPVGVPSNRPPSAASFSSASPILLLVLGLLSFLF